MELVALIEKGGPLMMLAVIAFLYVQERSERIQAQKDRVEAMEKLYTIATEVKEAIREFRELIRGGRQ